MWIVSFLIYFVQMLKMSTSCNIIFLLYGSVIVVTFFFFTGFVEVFGRAEQGTLFRKANIPSYTFFNYSNYKFIPSYCIKVIGDCGLENCNAIYYTESPSYLYCYLTQVKMISKRQFEYLIMIS